MNNRTIILKARDHLAALLAALVCGHVIGLIDLAGALPRGVMALDRFSGQIIGAAMCGLVYAIVLTTLYRRRLVSGPLYRCGETRPVTDYGRRFESGSVKLLDGWQYR